jgi:glutamine amidotransferase
MSERIAVVDYGMGNLHSVSKALEKVADSPRIEITRDPAAITAADRVVFPGVGAIRDCMAALAETGLGEAVLETARSGRPLLGICVGMQALMRHSEENRGIDCLGLFDGAVRRFADARDEQGGRLKVPHMGWNQVVQSDHALWRDIPDQSRFYFVHSYYVDGLPEGEWAGHCDYGVRFAAAVQRANVFAVQFHPEKSAPHGLTLLRNFLEWRP